MAKIDCTPGKNADLIQALNDANLTPEEWDDFSVFLRGVIDGKISVDFSNSQAARIMNDEITRAEALKELARSIASQHRH